MDILIRFGFSIEEINNMINSNEEINDISDSHIEDIIKILEEMGCGVNPIKNIFITNPFLLTREITEIKKLIVKLLDLGIEDLCFLFDSNPFLLNMDYKDVDSIVKSLSKDGYKKDDILDYFYYESNLIL